MSTALRIVHGNFGRVALLDMDCSLVRHAHPHCHVLLKVEGADTQFVVGNRIHPLTDSVAVLVDGWQPHSYVHDPARPRTLILALYVEPEWLKAFRPGWVASGAPGFFGHPHGELSPRIRKLTMDLASDMMARPECRAEHEALLSELMIAVIERFTPWKSFPRSIRELNASACDRRIRRAADYIRVNAGGEADIDTVVPVVDRLAAEGLSQRGSYGAGDGSRASPRFSRQGNWHPPWVFRPRTFHALLPQQRRRFAQRVPASLASCGLSVLHCNFKNETNWQVARAQGMAACRLC